MKRSLAIVLLMLGTLTTAAMANTDQIKAYKAAFEGEKPKCASCHTSDKPKKEDGMHDLNDYGKKAAALKEIPDDATYKEIGKAPEPAEA